MTRKSKLRIAVLLLCSYLSLSLSSSGQETGRAQIQESASPALPTLISQLGHNSGLARVAFSQDTELIASMDANGEVILWERKSGRQIWKKKSVQFSNGAEFLAFTPDGKNLIAAGLPSGDKLLVAELQLANGDTLRSWQKELSAKSSSAEDPKPPASVEKIDYSPGRHWIVITCDRTTFALKADLSGEDWFSDLFVTVSFSREERLMLAVDNAGRAKVFELSTQRELKTIPEGASKLTVATLSGAGSHALTGYDDGSVSLWDVQSGNRIQHISSPQIKGTANQNGGPLVQFSPDGTTFIVSAPVRQGSSDVRSFVYQTSTQELLRQLQGGSATFSPEGKYIATREYEGRGHFNTYFWNSSTGAKHLGFVFIPKDRSDTRHDVFTYSFSKDDGLLMTDTILWDVAERAELKRLEGYQAMMRGPKLSPDGAMMIAASDDGNARLWDLNRGRISGSFIGKETDAGTVTFAPDGKSFLSGSRWIGFNPNQAGKVEGDAVTVWSLSSQKKMTTVAFSASFREVVAAQYFLVTSQAISSDNRYVLASYNRKIHMWDVGSGKAVWSPDDEDLDNPQSGVVAFSPNGRNFLIANDLFQHIPIYRTDTRKVNIKIPYRDLFVASEGGARHIWVNISRAGFSPNGKSVYTLSNFANEDKFSFQLIDLKSQKTVVHIPQISGFAFTKDGQFVLHWDGDKGFKIWSVESNKEVHISTAEIQLASDEALLQAGRLLVFKSENGAVRVWNQSEGRELCRLIAFDNEDWAVVAPDGRFDTNNLEELRGLHWIAPDDPLRPLPIEIFVRDYYEPRLLPRLLRGDPLPNVPDLTSLNRVQPEVKIRKVTLAPNAQDSVIVDLEVASMTGTQRQDGKPVILQSGGFDLRLFREGQLVGYQAGNLIPDSATTAIISLPVRLPHSTGPLEFTAYVFNSDRVKSATAKSTFSPPQAPLPMKRRAYVISVGVNAYQDASWNLSFAARDAQLSAAVLTRKLEAQRAYEVVSVTLISEYEETASGRTETKKLATKQNFQTVLNLLAYGPERVNAKLIQQIPGAGKLRKAEPDDLVVITFSSHGYADKQGRFYLLPYDTGSEIQFSPDGQTITPESLSRFISSDDLSEWVRDIDAGELVMIVDSCHAAGAIDQPGFKPGPMGSRGMGQLAYDKGMRLLAASQAEDVALEVSKIRQGLLTYALIRDGLEKEKADQNRDRRIMFDEWLGYAADRVPALYAEVKAGKLRTLRRKDLQITALVTGASVKKRNAYQQPQLFDFKRKRRDVLLTNLNAGSSVRSTGMTVNRNRPNAQPRQKPRPPRP